MKKIILSGILLATIILPATAQQQKTKEESREIIIINNDGKQKKITIETKDGETLINGKPASEFKDDGVSVITTPYNFSYAPALSGLMFNNGEKSAFLGVTTEKSDNGVKITDVTKNSGADKAGLKQGDVITKVGDKKIADPDELMKAINNYKAKEDVKITYERDGRANVATATLGSRTTLFNSFGTGQYKTEMFKDFNVRMPSLKAFTTTQPFTMQYGFNRGRLGVQIEDTENDNGVKITDVQAESNAEKAGLKKDDIITEINGSRIKNIIEIRKQLNEVKDKNSYSLKVKRNGADMNFEIKIPKKLNKANL